MSFTQFNLHPKILKALELCGYTNPTPIQTKSIPEIMKGKDLVASAQTGTGKTASFVLPALHLLLSEKAKTPSPRVLVLTPTRELANQITDAISKYARFMQCSVVSIVGGMSYKTQFNNLARPVDIIVATPGRLLDHMENRKIDLSHVELLVLDEADRMLDMGFVDDVREIASATPANRQTLLFSATMDDDLAPIIRKFMKDPVRIDLSQENISPHQIKQKVYYADNSLHKSKLLTHFLQNENVFKAIIFSATKVNADDLADELNHLGIRAAALHGDMKQGARNRITEQFKRGKIQFLVATDVASRGIDVKDITHVINYDLPKFSEDYVHRIGRTGRAGKEGIAISFISPFDAKHVGKIERFINQRLEAHTIPGLEPRDNTGATHRPGKKDKGRHRDRDSRDRGKGSFKDRDKEHKRRHFDKRKGQDDRDQRLGKIHRDKAQAKNSQFDANEIKEWQDKLDQKREFKSDKKERGGFRGRSLSNNNEHRGRRKDTREPNYGDQDERPRYPREDRKEKRDDGFRGREEREGAEQGSRRRDRNRDDRGFRQREDREGGERKPHRDGARGGRSGFRGKESRDDDRPRDRSREDRGGLRGREGRDGERSSRPRDGAREDRGGFRSREGRDDRPRDRNRDERGGFRGRDDRDGERKSRGGDRDGGRKTSSGDRDRKPGSRDGFRGKSLSRDGGEGRSSRPRSGGGGFSKKSGKRRG